METVMEEPILISEEKLLKEQEFILAEKKAIKDSALLNGDYVPDWVEA